MNDYPLRVKIVASTWIVLAYVIGLPLFVLIYAAGAWADRCDRRRHLLSEIDNGNWRARSGTL